MPKGQYDRKAAAAKRAAKATLGKTGVGKTVTSETPRVKRKYTKRAKTEENALSQLASGTAGPGPFGQSDMGELHGLTNLLGNLSSINQQAAAIGQPSLGLGALIKKTVKTLENKFDALFPAEDALASMGNGHTIQAVTTLPVPEKFVIPPPPPAPSNPS